MRTLHYQGNIQRTSTMKYFISLNILLFALFSSNISAQEANDIAPPPPPEFNDDKKEAKKPPPKKKKKLKHCGPTTAKLCDQIDKISEFGEESWKTAAIGASLCSQSAAIEATRKRRKDKIEYEKTLQRIAKDEGKKHERWKPSESNTTFARRTGKECEANMNFWCEEMKISAVDIQDATIQSQTIALVDKACK